MTRAFGLAMLLLVVSAASAGAQTSVVESCPAIGLLTAEGAIANSPCSGSNGQLSLAGVCDADCLARALLQSPLPQVPENAHNPATHAAIAFLMGAHFIDLSTTMYFIGKCSGGCATVDGQRIRAEEQNPRLAQYQHDPTRFALAKYGSALGQIATVYLIHRQHPKLARFVAYAAGAVTLSIGLNNQQLLDTTK